MTKEDVGLIFSPNTWDGSMIETEPHNTDEIASRMLLLNSNHCRSELSVPRHAVAFYPVQPLLNARAKRNLTIEGCKETHQHIQRQELGIIGEVAFGLLTCTEAWWHRLIYPDNWLPVWDLQPCNWGYPCKVSVKTVDTASHPDAKLKVPVKQQRDNEGIYILFGTGRIVIGGMMSVVAHPLGYIEGEQLFAEGNIVPKSGSYPSRCCVSQSKLKSFDKLLEYTEALDRQNKWHHGPQIKQSLDI